MSRTERAKGLRGEAEIAALYRAHGLTVRGLEGSGDHLIVCDPDSGLVLHSEVKRQETARPWTWWAQAIAEAAPGSIPVVHFRRNNSRWLAIVSADDLAALLVLAARQPDGARLAESAEWLARNVIDFAENEVPDEWDGGSLGYSVGGLCNGAGEVLRALSRGRP